MNIKGLALLQFYVFTKLMIFATEPKGETLNYLEQELIRKLFNSANYSRDARPVANKSVAFNVTFDLAYSQLIDLDSKNQILSSKVWIRQKWNNPYLTWNPDDYAGISHLNVDPKKVWVPDIVLYNNVGLEKTGSLTYFDTKVVIQHDGTNKWYAPTEVKSICKIDITYFPFDKQECPLKFGSWTYNGDQLNFSNQRDTADISQYIPSGEWDLTGAPAKQNVVRYSCCPSPFIDITFTICVRRRVLFYVVNLIAPCIVLSALIIFSFQLPPESGERMGVVITILLGLTVFMLLLTDNVPRTSEVIPLIAKYSFAVMVEIALSLICTCFSLRVFHRHPTRKVPFWLHHLVFKILAPVFLMVPPKSRQTEQESSKHTRDVCGLSSKTVYKKPYFCMSRLPNGSLTCHDKGKSNAETNSLLENGGIEICVQKESEFMKPSVLNDISPDVALKFDEMISCMHSVIDHLTATRATETRKDEWHFVAMVMDRFFFWIFMITIISSSVLFYTLIPDLG